MQALALTALVAVFSPVCDVSEYELSFTNTSLPQHTPFPQLLHQLQPQPQLLDQLQLPPGDQGQHHHHHHQGKHQGQGQDQGEQEYGHDFLRWYDEGLSACRTFLETDPFKDEKKKKMSPLFNNNPNEIATASSCRGNHMLYDTTGLIVWPFGPIGECETYSRCWFGLLTCGEFKHDQFQSTFEWKDRVFSGWSMKSLHVDMSVSGPEIVAPRVRHTTVPRVDHSQGSKGEASVLVADYLLTVNGEYSIDLGLMGLYPQVLYSSDRNSNSKRHLLDRKIKSKTMSQPKGKAGKVEKKSGNGHKKLQEKLKSNLKFKQEKDIVDDSSLELLRSVFLGGCERRPSGRTFCVPECQKQSQVYGSPFVMKAKYVDPIARCPSTARREPKPLPLCTGGNHRGRYLKIPPALLQHCNGTEYGDRLVAERARQFGKRQWFDKYEAIENDYFKNAQNIDLSVIIAEMIVKSKANPRADGDNAISREDVHYAELLRYLDSENICLLVDIGLNKKVPSSRAEIYAPYSCKYRVYDSAKAAQCSLEDRGMVIFHGDSMSRALFGKILMIKYSLDPMQSI